MKKKYEKPFLEFLEFFVDEELLAPIEGNMSETEADPDWE